MLSDQVTIRRCWRGWRGWMNRGHADEPELSDVAWLTFYGLASLRYSCSNFVP